MVKNILWYHYVQKFDRDGKIQFVGFLPNSKKVTDYIRKCHNIMAKKI